MLRKTTNLLINMIILVIETMAFIYCLFAEMSDADAVRNFIDHDEHTIVGQYTYIIIMHR